MLDAVPTLSAADFSKQKFFAIIETTSAILAAPLAQLDRASGYEPEGREFESLRAHHSSILARSKIRSKGFRYIG